MEALKIDRTKLIKVSSYAKKMGVSTVQVYNWIKDKKVREIVIDGVKFIDTSQV